MRQAIVTKFIGPTNHRSARVKATAAAGSIFVTWDDALDVNANHTRAALQLARKYGWTGTWEGGGMPDGSGNVYVCATPFLRADRNDPIGDDYFTVARLDPGCAADPR